MKLNTLEFNGSIDNFNVWIKNSEPIVGEGVKTCDMSGIESALAPLLTKRSVNFYMKMTTLTPFYASITHHIHYQAQTNVIICYVIH